MTLPIALRGSQRISLNRSNLSPSISTNPGNELAPHSTEIVCGNSVFAVRTTESLYHSHQPGHLLPFEQLNHCSTRIDLAIFAVCVAIPNLMEEKVRKHRRHNHEIRAKHRWATVHTYLFACMRIVAYSAIPRSHEHFSLVLRKSQDVRFTDSAKIQRRFAKRLRFPEVFVVAEFVSANDFAVGTFQRSHEDSVCNDVSEGSRDSGTTSLLLQHRPLDSQERGNGLAFACDCDE
jgi:hypothetical protein